MAIIQISKIQQRAGDLVDLPQLDEAEFGFASDEKRLFIGKTTDNPENIEVLTSYSNISFSQVQGAVGNLNVDPLTVEEGQVLAYDATDNAWENRGGNSGGLINLGNPSNLIISGGAIGYVLQTDGTGNISWQPKGVVTLYIQNVTQDANSVITFTDEFALSNAQQVTITGVTGMTELNGNSYYLGNLTTNTANLYTDSALSIPLDTSGFNAFPYTSVTDTTAVTNDITVGDASLFTVNDPVKFVGTTFGGIIANQTYYILSASGTTITVSETLGGSELLLATDSGSCNVYVTGGKAVATVSGGGGGNTGTSSNTQVLFNFNNIPAGDSKFTFDYTTGQLVLTGNASVSNLSSTTLVQASRYVSNVATGTAPITVASTTKVANLNVDLLDGYDSSQTAVANTVVVRDANANVVANNFTGANLALTGTISVTGNITAGNISATLLTGTLTTAAQPNITSVGTLTSLNVSGNANVANLNATRVFASANITTPQFISNVATGTSPILVSSNTLVANLNADLLDGYNSSIAAAANTVVVRDANGNIAGNTLLSNSVFTGNVNTSNVTTANLSVTGNTLLSNVNISGTANIATLLTTVITTGANTTAGSITGNWSLTTGSRLQATYADLAEYYAADKTYLPGTVLDFGGENEVTIAGIESNKLAGVVTTEPAYVMNGSIQAEYPVMIALIGRVPVRVQGPVFKGNMLVSAGNGLAKVATSTPKIGTVIGKAIANKTDDGVGMVEVMVGRM